MNTKYPIEAFQALALFLYQTVESKYFPAESVEDKYFTNDFEFGESPIGPTDMSSDGRTLAAIKEFYSVLPDQEKLELICAAFADSDDSFLEYAWTHVARYLLNSANFRADATDVLREYLKDIAEGIIADEAFDDYVQRCIDGRLSA